MTPEGKVKAEIRKVLDAARDAGYKVWWFAPPANGFGRAGIPDVVGAVYGAAFAVEAKAGAGQLTAMQQREIERMVQNGVKVWIVRETNVEHFKVEFMGWCALCS